MSISPQAAWVINQLMQWVYALTCIAVVVVVYSALTSFLAFSLFWAVVLGIGAGMGFLYAIGYLFDWDF